MKAACLRFSGAARAANLSSATNPNEPPLLHMKRYLLELEISGAMGLFGNPASGGTPTSYRIPTWSAAKGVFESIARLDSGDAWINPLRVQICRFRDQKRKTYFQNYATNYGGPLRKNDQRRKGNSYQLFATVLVNPCFRLFAEIRSGETEKNRRDYNPRHYLQHLFNRRLRQGRCHATPVLGLSEFTADYWGPFRNGSDDNKLVTEVDESESFLIPSFLTTVFDRTNRGEYSPRFRQNVLIRNGELSYVE